jgi:CheY-like chemotaxis protein
MNERRVRQRRRGIARRQDDVPSADIPRLLLVIEDVEARLKYAALLEESGYAVYAVSEPIEALKTMTSRVPDALLLGSGCSGPDCLRLLSALRGDVATADVPAVVLTSAQVQGAPSRSSGTTVLLGEPVPADVVLGAIDDLTRATPVERFTRRQLRRTLVALRSIIDEYSERPRMPGDTADDAIDWPSVIGRFHSPILGLNAEGNYIAASRGAETLTGYLNSELTAASVFDAGMGSHLPLASVWQAHREGTGATTGLTTIRGKSGRTLKVAYVITALAPTLHVLLLAHTV